MTKEIGGNTPLHKWLPIAKARALIKQGADVDAIGQYRARPLHIAAFRGDAEMVKLLIKAGADVNAAGPGESTPVHQLACMFGAKVKRADYPKALRLLIEAGASTEKQNDCGKKPIDGVSGTKQKRKFLKIIAEVRSERDENGENMIKEIEIRGIGPIEKRKKLVFKPGVNILVGRNTSGKTYLLSKLEITGFKSIRNAAIELSPTYGAANASEQSVLNDAIRFALGETSFKCLRAKSVSDFIAPSFGAAMVTVYITGPENYAIRRTIDSEGSTAYQLNGKKVDRTAVTEILKSIGIRFE